MCDNLLMIFVNIKYPLILNVHDLTKRISTYLFYQFICYVSINQIKIHNIEGSHQFFCFVCAIVCYSMKFFETFFFTPKSYKQTCYFHSTNLHLIQLFFFFFTSDIVSLLIHFFFNYFSLLCFAFTQLLFRIFIFIFFPLCRYLLFFFFCVCINVCMCVCSYQSIWFITFFLLEKLFKMIS